MSSPKSLRRKIITVDDLESNQKLLAELAELNQKKTKQRIVLKIGSGSIVETPQNENDKVVISLITLSSLVQTICSLRKLGHEVCLVTSGAVAVGCMTLGIPKPSNSSIPVKQALSAVGQSHLLRLYDQLFSLFDQHTAQILLSYAEFGDHNRYTNAANTMEQLFIRGIVPIINENDAVAVEELRLGDNDRLAGLVSCLINADWLFLLTDVQGVYTQNPKSNPDSKLISIVDDVRTLERDINISTNQVSWGTGGMSTKIYASSLASSAGIKSVIMKASNVQAVVGILQGKALCGTFVRPAQFQTRFGKGFSSKNQHKKWIAYASRLSSPTYTQALSSSTIKDPATHSGRVIMIDRGAVIGLQKKNSLFAAGIKAVYGKFGPQMIVNVFCLKKDFYDEEEGEQHSGDEFLEIASGISNYSSEEIELIKGKKSSEFFSLLGYYGAESVLDRNNIVFWGDRLSQ